MFSSDWGQYCRNGKIKRETLHQNHMQITQTIIEKNKEHGMSMKAKARILRQLEKSKQRI